MRKQFPLYRALLHLYPRSYRREYGDQMVQTLQDMLDDHSNSGSRAMIWLRVVLETPLSIVQENISIGGEKTMDKLTALSNKKLGIGAGIVVLLVLLVGIVLGRNTLLSNATKILYGHKVQTMTASADTELGSPFLALTGTEPKLGATNCNEIAHGLISTEIDCESQMHAYTKLGQSAEAEAAVMKSVASLEDSLKTHGYKTDPSRGITLTSLVSGTYKGIDWTPDAFYERVSGSYDCVFDTQIAYSNLAHQQPAISLTLSCSRTFDILGRSTNEVYSSSKGILR